MSALDEFTDEPVSTGLTATVMTPEAIQAAKALILLPDNLTTVILAQLARDIALDVASRPAIFKKYGITQAHYDFLERHNEFFRNALQHQIKDIQSVKNTQERLRLQAAAALEEQLPTIASRMGSRTEELRDVVEGAKLLAKMAGVDTQERQAGSAGERFTITIDLGADRVVVGSNAGANAIPASVEPEGVRADTSRTIDVTAVQQNPKAA